MLWEVKEVKGIGAELPTSSERGASAEKEVPA